MPRPDKKTQKNIYLDEVFGSEDSFLQEIQKATKTEGVGRMQVSPHEARILQFLVQISKSKKSYRARNSLCLLHLTYS